MQNQDSVNSYSAQQDISLILLILLRKRGKMAKQIEMNYKLESGYEVIYPNVILNSVTDWASSIYSKSEIDDKVSEINQSINDAQMNPGGWENLGTFKLKTGSYKVTYNESFGSNGSDTGIVLNLQYEYWIKINFFGTANTGISTNKSCDVHMDVGNYVYFIDGQDYDFGISTWRWIGACSYRPYQKDGKIGFALSSGPTGTEENYNNFIVEENNTTIKLTASIYIYQGGTINITQNDWTFYRRKVNNLT